MDTTVKKNIRDRLTGLNTRGYYLLVALSVLFSYSQPEKPLFLKLVLTLTALVAVLPVQVLFKSLYALEGIRALKIAFLTGALVCALVWVWCSATSTAAAQEQASAQPTIQQKPKQPAANNDSRLKAVEEKADRALMEKDYIERIQKESKDFYDKAFNTQLIFVSVTALIVGLVGKFGVDHIVQSKLTEATANLREGFGKELADELNTLKESNRAQIQELQEALEKRVHALEADLKLRSNWQVQFLQGMTSAADGRHDDAVDSFSRAVRLYKTGKRKGVVERAAGEASIYNLCKALWHSTDNEGDRDELVRQELKRKLFDDLEDELAATALRVDWLGPLVKERKQAPQVPAPESATTEATPSLTPPEEATPGTSPALRDERTTK